MGPTPFVSPELLDRLVAILELAEGPSVRQLGQSVESALRDYESELRNPPPKATELHATFDRLVGKARELREGLAGLHPAEARALDDARELAAWLHSQREVDPALTLRVYAHALPEEERDLGFADFQAISDSANTHQTSPALSVHAADSA